MKALGWVVRKKGPFGDQHDGSGEGWSKMKIIHEVLDRLSSG